MTSSTDQAPTLSLDVVIFGGGVAGLWLLSRLRREGYQAVLLEADKLGSGQTRYAQGIVHGGIKYALTGTLTPATRAVAAMPGRWRDCLCGTGEINLRQVRLLAEHQYLWSTSRLSSRMAGFFASKLMRSRTRTVGEADRPEVFHHPQFTGQVYRLDEPILDTATLVRTLAEPHRDAIWAIDWPEGVRCEAADPDQMAVIELSLGGQQLRLEAKRLVLAAGKGNAALLAALGRSAPPMQLRPLQMVMARGALPVLYAHCLGASANPRITITTHGDQNGQPVWYLGGQLAEEGVGRSAPGQIKVAQQELADLFPWLDFSDLQWATLAIDRAEARQPDGQRPESVFAAEDGGVITAWPTKLALSPLLSDEVMALLTQGAVDPSPVPVKLPHWPHPGYAPLPWQEEERWT
ncbi:MAG: hypothetical protein A2V90_00795 [Gammaproteobacteria bacterium RBG_16_57_12]|nr:MAG: hypothetical protein A2V90_00795 [Gammaproteobacteria bacterium RBG_16_57_12]